MAELDVLAIWGKCSNEHSPNGEANVRAFAAAILEAAAQEAFQTCWKLGNACSCGSAAACIPDAIRALAPRAAGE